MKRFGIVLLACLCWALLAELCYAQEAGDFQPAATNVWGAEYPRVDSQGRVQLRVHDDGKGAAGETSSTGFGLKGIRERAEQLKGSANYRTAPSEGFTLYVELPA